MLEIENNYYEITATDSSDCANLTVKKIENSNTQYNDFFEHFMCRNLPCVIKNVSSTWDCTKKWIKKDSIDHDYLIVKYGHLVAPVADCNNVEFNAHCKTEMTIKEYMTYLKGSKDKLLYLKDWHLKRLQPLDNFYEAPLQFSSDWLNEYALDNHDDDFMFVYIGPKGSWTPLHADVYHSYSWSVNVIGRKKWILFPPGEEKKLCDVLQNLPMLFDQDKHKNVTFFEIFQEQGDAIFVPSGWYHQVCNLQDTISINHNWINGCNIDKMWNALKNNLLSVEHEIEEFKGTEGFQMQCQLILKSVFGMELKQFIKFICHIGNKRLKQLQTGNHKTFGNYNLGLNHIIFDLHNVSKTMDKVVSHPHFNINKDIVSLELQNELFVIKNLISNFLTKNSVNLK